MIIYDSYDNVLLETNVSDKSSLYCGLDNKDRLTLHFTLDRLVEIPIGSWCNFEGNRYEVMSDADVKMNHTENYDYTVVLSSYFALTSRYKVRNFVDRRLKFDLVAKPHEHLQMIVDNLNARDGGWSIGSCIDSVEKLVSYNHTNCEEALINIADTFSTEIEVVGKVISLKKVEYFKDDPLALSYGKGNGFRPGIQRTSVDDGLPVQRLFVQGGNRNISLKEYGSSELHLPKSLSFKFDGNKFEGEDGFVEKYATAFITDTDGMSVSVEGMTGGMEDSLDLSEVYPSRVGKVTGVVYIFKGREYATPESSWTADDWNEVQIDIVDETIPNSLDFNDCLLENNESLTVIFQSGMLAGREFNANYLSDKKRFQLIKQEFDGQQMPQESYIPKIDDSYAVFNVYLPASYISDATTYSGAEYDMLREASRYLYEKCVSEFNFAGEIDGMWAKKNWETIGPRMRIGSYVSFTHEKMFPEEPALVRIVGITQYVNNPHYPKIELSNSVGVSTVSSRLNKIENKDAHVEELYEEARRYTKRRYYDIKQTIEMLSDAFDNYSEGINPITVETMLAVVGNKSLQYFFTQSIDTDVPSVLEYSFDPNDGVFSVSDAFIKHMTLGIDSISPVHSNDEYLRWNVAAYASESLEKDSGYYLYAKVSKDSQQGTFMLSKQSIKIEADEGYYNLLVGILNAEVDGERSFASMYGFTEILPGQITTDTIKSADGKTWLDLLKGILHLNNMAGVSGVKDSAKGDKSIAAWFGGLMQDLEFDKDADSPAKSVIRHDGTGYFARGLFSWDKEIGINLGKGQIKINYDGSIDFGGNIRIGSTGEETLDSLLTIVSMLTSMWSFDESGNLVTDKQVVIKNNLIVEQDTSSGGDGQDTPGGSGGVSEEDVLNILQKNDYITSSALSNYYTKGEILNLSTQLKEWVNDKGYISGITSAMVTDALGYTPLSTSGGTISGTTMRPLIVETTSSAIETQFKTKDGIRIYLGWSNIDGIFLQEGVSTKYVGIKTDGTPYYYNGTYNTLIHSGNIGSYKAGDSALFDGRTSGEYYLSQKNGIPNGDLANLGAGSYYAASAKGDINPLPIDYCSLSVLGQSYYSQQLCMYHNATRAWLRGIYNTSSGVSATEWHELAFTDSNVASATKLATARTIWGQSFDGSGNVSGNLYLGTGTIRSSKSGTDRVFIDFGSAGDPYIGYGIASAGIDSHLCGNNIYLHYGTSRTNGLILNSSGNVTISYSDLAGTSARLAVNGNTRIYRPASATEYLDISVADVQVTYNAYDPDGYSRHVFKSNGTTVMSILGHNGHVLIGTTTDNGYKLDVNGALGMGGIEILDKKSNALYIGYGSTLKSELPTYLWGKGIHFIDSGGQIRMFIADGGNVGLGTTTPAYKLDVNGEVRATTFRFYDDYRSRITLNSSYIDIISAGNEMCIGTNSGDETMYINYRNSTGSGTVKAYRWNAGNPSSHADFYIGNAYCSGLYLREADSSFSPINTFGMYIWDNVVQFTKRSLSDSYLAEVFSLNLSTNLAKVTGDLIVSGDTSSGSDIRFKDIISNKTIRIEDIANAPLFTFKWNDRDDDTIHLGSSAQYWEKVTPWLVKGEDFKTLDYSTLGVAMGISLAKKAVNHEERIKLLEKENKALKEEIRRMQYGS